MFYLNSHIKKLLNTKAGTFHWLLTIIWTLTTYIHCFYIITIDSRIPKLATNKYLKAFNFYILITIEYTFTQKAIFYNLWIILLYVHLLVKYINNWVNPRYLSGSVHYLSSEVLQDGGTVYCSGGSHTSMTGGAVLQVTVDTTHGELETQAALLQSRKDL